MSPSSVADDRGVIDALVVSRVNKTFAGTRALRDVTFAIGQGSVHALMGGNGSGKSTLVKILAGVHSADPGRGEIVVGDSVLRANTMTPTLARAHGLRFVHQNPTTFAGLTVGENLALGHRFQTSATGRIRWSQLHTQANSVLKNFGIPAESTQPMRSLSPAASSMVAIARALRDLQDGRPGVLVLDEPTASLPKAEVDLLLTAIRGFASAGQTILFISHRVDEVLAVADHITVLRDGLVEGTVTAESLDERALIGMIVGRTPNSTAHSQTRRGAQDVALECRDLKGGPLADVSLAVRRGEILGVAGLLGSGRTHLLQTIFGARTSTSGQVLVDGSVLPPGGPRARMAAGIAYVPEDRAGGAAFLEMSVEENMNIGRPARHWAGFRIKRSEERAENRQSAAKFLVKAASIESPMTTLSGGNQQKVILARWLDRQPKVLLLDEPTQGVDIAARNEIHQLVRTAAEDGCAVVLVTSDLEELSRFCDRILVLAKGRTKAIVDAGMDAHGITEMIYSTEVQI